MVVALASFGLADALGGWWPDRTVGPLLALARAWRSSPRCRSPGSIALAATANGIAVFMLFGAGLTAGLLGQIAEAIGSDTLDDVAQIATWALPFEALYQAGLADLTVDTVGFARLAIDLGPVRRRAVGGLGLWLFSLATCSLVGASRAAFAAAFSAPRPRSPVRGSPARRPPTERDDVDTGAEAVLDRERRRAGLGGRRLGSARRPAARRRSPRRARRTRTSR